jgi:hypothetical protein
MAMPTKHEDSLCPSVEPPLALPALAEGACTGAEALAACPALPATSEKDLAPLDTANTERLMENMVYDTRDGDGDDERKEVSE